MNGHFMRAMSDDELFHGADRRPALSAGRARDRGPSSTSAKRTQLRAAIPGLKERAKTLVELARRRGLPVRGAAACRWTRRPPTSSRKGGGAHLAALLPKLTRSSRNGQVRRSRPSCAPTPRRPERSSASVAQPLRAALTGRSTSPGIFDVLTVLGREESLGRIAGSGEAVGAIAFPEAVADRRPADMQAARLFRPNRKLCGESESGAAGGLELGGGFSRGDAPPHRAAHWTRRLKIKSGRGKYASLGPNFQRAMDPRR